MRIHTLESAVLEAASGIISGKMNITDNRYGRFRGGGGSENGLRSRHSKNARRRSFGRRLLLRLSVPAAIE